MSSHPVNTRSKLYTTSDVYCLQKVHLHAVVALAGRCNG